ncbi:hypothetical protein [Gordonia sihwensis]|uniref:hypothetical protein n=1 Tax=Gordonia sihwensis TaxID=173559 RepID=UPI0005ED6987|nr:hypothetical protein [Gordonia sihwensis]KJR05973.1 hypothetical protein UG54_14980 [Gordonia sihwensis]
MTEHQPPVNVHIQTGTGELLRIVATLLLFGGAGAIAWTVAQGPNAEMAASGLSMMLVMMVKLAYARGRIAIPKGGNDTDDFAVNKAVVGQMASEYQRWMAKASMPVMALIAAGYAVGFLILRAGVAAALGIFSNIVFAGGAAAMVGALVVFPSLVPNMIRGLKGKGVVTDPPVVVPAAVQPVVPVAAPVPATAPAAVQPDARQVKKVVRKVKVKKESQDV